MCSGTGCMSFQGHGEGTIAAGFGGDYEWCGDGDGVGGVGEGVYGECGVWGGSGSGDACVSNEVRCRGHVGREGEGWSRGGCVYGTLSVKYAWWMLEGVSYDPPLYVGAAWVDTAVCLSLLVFPRLKDF